MKNVLALVGTLLLAACGENLPQVPDCTPEEYPNIYPQEREVLTFLWHDKWKVKACPPEIVLVTPEKALRKGDLYCLPNMEGVNCAQGNYAPYEHRLYLVTPYTGIQHLYGDRLWTTTVLAHELRHAALLMESVARGEPDADPHHLRSDWYEVYPDGGPVQWSMYWAGFERAKSTSDSETSPPTPAQGRPSCADLVFSF